jgi:hypothetical protein
VVSESIFVVQPIKDTHSSTSSCDLHETETTIRGTPCAPKCFCCLFPSIHHPAAFGEDTICVRRSIMAPRRRKYAPEKAVKVVASTLCQKCSAKRFLASSPIFHEGINHQSKTSLRKEAALFLSSYMPYNAGSSY